MAAAVFHRRTAGATHVVRARQSKRAGSVAPFADELDNLTARYISELEAIRLRRGFDGDDEFRLPWHPGNVPDLFATAAWIHAAADVRFHCVFHGRSDLRRPGVRIFFRPGRATPCHGVGSPSGSGYDSFVGFRPQSATDSGWRILHAIHGARRVGRDTTPHQ